MRSLSTIDLIAFATGLQYTLLLVLMALAFGAPFGLFLALLRTANMAVLRWASALFLQVVQAVPLLALLMFFYFGLPVFLGIQIPALAAVTVAFTIYTAVFLGEIWRGGIEAVKQTQWEAAASLGISRWQQFRYVIAPQAFKIALPATVGFLVQLIKGTSLAAVVGFIELTRAGQLASAATFQPLLVYSVVAAIYFAICFPLTLWSRNLETRLNGSR
ncbi:ABC transporter permease subunit [Aliihoeflea aestuarii]|jgi:polar amino acid transport system permease protein|uniref:amino acid ABC transporter permease n=1 Tax=Aliihoeflea aestuarii TaxID=453840 RepID=UPI002093894A|nr:amino acid ABC transporter permease [Aliihoeflea aestuarii]MCO6390827.1 ABC transporter permease subunit [Aliihoeflea aestuarii]